MANWILCKDKLPCRGIKVITTEIDFDGNRYVTENALDIYGRWAKDNGTIAILAWMYPPRACEADISYAVQKTKILRPDSFENFEELYDLYISSKMTKVKFAQQLGVSRPTLDKLLKRRENK